MKIKLDFVTNSSSVCYLIVAPSKVTKKSLKENGIMESRIKYFACATNIKRLISITEGQPCDWIRLARGPNVYWNLTEELYPRAKEIIDNGKCVVIVDMDRNHQDDMENFEEIIIGMGCTIASKESD